MRLPKGIIVDVSAADAQRLIDAGHAELREAADPELSEEDASTGRRRSHSEEDVGPEEDATGGRRVPDTNEDITGGRRSTEEDVVPEEDAALEEDRSTGRRPVPEEDADWKKTQYRRGVVWRKTPPKSAGLPDADEDFQEETDEETEAEEHLVTEA